MPIVELEEMAWAAGLFEGEGTIISLKRLNANHLPQFCIAITMTDKDIIERFTNIVGAGKMSGPIVSKNPKWRPACHRQAGGRRGREILIQFWPWLGSRRKLRARELWNETSNRYKILCPL